MSLFECHNTDENAQSIADYLPNGQLFAAKNIPDSVYRMLLRGFGRFDKDAEAFLCLFADELDISNTTAFINEWEDSVGIPDGCFTKNKPIETRRLQVLLKLAAMGVQTAQDFIDLAALLGIYIEIVPGAEAGGFTYTFPIIFAETGKEAKFTMIVLYLETATEVFPYTFPIVFGESALSILRCLFSKLKPANVKLIFRQIDDPGPSAPGAFSLGFSDGFES